MGVLKNFVYKKDRILASIYEDQINSIEIMAEMLGYEMREMSSERKVSSLRLQMPGKSQFFELTFGRDIARVRVEGWPAIADELVWSRVSGRADFEKTLADSLNQIQKLL